MKFRSIYAACSLMLILVAWPGRVAGQEDKFFLNIVGHTLKEDPAPDGQIVKRIRLYVQLRTSEDDPMPPKYRPEMNKFAIGSAFGGAELKQIGTFGGDNGLGTGVSTLLMVDVSGSMVRYWDIIHTAALKAIENMGEHDQLGIAFFGGDWVFSGLKSYKRQKDLIAWVDEQIPEEVFEWSLRRRELGRREFRSEFGHGIRWWQKFVDEALDIKTTKLYNILYAKALDEGALGSREVKALVILSDMMDESQWEDEKGGRPIEGPCEPANDCATLEHVRTKAEMNRVPVFAIGFRDISPEDGSTINRTELNDFKLLTRQTRGEYQETSDLTEMDALFSGVRRGLSRLIVADVDFCQLPRRTGFNYITIKYEDDAAGILVDSMSYKIDFSELSNAADCPVLCDPPCDLLTHVCEDGECSKLIPPPCCEENAQCEPPLKCLSPQESGNPVPTCMAITNGLSCSQPKKKPELPADKKCTACELWNEGVQQCIWLPCDFEEDEMCNPSCRCVKGTPDIPDHCEPQKPPEPPPEGQCLADEHCMGKCDGQLPCICVLETVDPEQCAVKPEERDGPKVCKIGPQECGEDEFYFEDQLHCGCVTCETDSDCAESISREYRCTGTKGGVKTCIKKDEWVKKALKYAIPALIGLLLLVFLLKVLRPRDPLARKKKPGSPPKPKVGPRSYSGQK